MININCSPTTVTMTKGDTLTINLSVKTRLFDFNDDPLVVKMAEINIDEHSTESVKLTTIRNDGQVQALVTRLIHSLSSKELSEQFRYDLMTHGLIYAVGRLSENDDYQQS